jgi:hypothetical protein
MALGAEVESFAGVHHRHSAGSIEVGVGGELFRFAVRRPADVANAALPCSPLRLKPLGEVQQLPLCPQAAQLLLTIHYGDAG